MRSLAEKESRDGFVAAHIEEGLAFQIHKTRRARGWTKAELAERAGMTQERISRLEEPNYGRYTISTLQRLAAAFDVALIVRFAPFSQLVDHIVDLSAEDIAVPGFEEPTP